MSKFDGPFARMLEAINRWMRPPCPECVRGVELEPKPDDVVVVREG